MRRAWRGKQTFPGGALAQRTLRTRAKKPGISATPHPRCLRLPRQPHGSGVLLGRWRAKHIVGAPGQDRL
eukprot:9158099-Lingulodinium_polyedra.AAC.1